MCKDGACSTSCATDVKKTIEGLKGVDAEYLAIFTQFKKENLELEAKVCKLLFS